MDNQRVWWVRHAITEAAGRCQFAAAGVYLRCRSDGRMSCVVCVRHRRSAYGGGPTGSTLFHRCWKRIYICGRRCYRTGGDLLVYWPVSKSIGWVRLYPWARCVDGQDTSRHLCSIASLGVPHCLQRRYAERCGRYHSCIRLIGFRVKSARDTCALARYLLKVLPFAKKKKKSRTVGARVHESACARQTAVRRNV